MVPTKYLIALSLFALLPFFHLGCDVAIQMSADTIRQDLGLMDSQQNQVVHVTGRASIFGAVVAGLVLNYVGRWGIITLGLCFHVAGVVLTGAGPAYEVVVTGRVLMGLSFGIGITAGPIYVAEMAPANCRGFLLSLSQLLFTVGEVLGYLAQYFTHTHLAPHVAWRVVIAGGALMSLILVVFLRSSFTESPCYLVLRGRVDEANDLMTRCGTTQSERQCRLDQLKHLARIPPTPATIEAPVPSIFVTLKQMWPEFLMASLPVYSTLVFLVTLHSFSPLSGADVAILLGRSYFGKIGDAPLQYYLIAEVISVGVRVATSLFPILMMDIMGRRRMLLISILMTTGATGFLGVVDELNHHQILGDENAAMFHVGLQIVLQTGHAMGLGAVPWVYGPESFRFLVRAPAVGIGVAMNQAVVSIVATNLGAWYLRFHKGDIFFMCCGMMVVTFTSCFLFFTDMTGLALVETVIPVAIPLST